MLQTDQGFLRKPEVAPRKGILRFWTWNFRGTRVHDLVSAWRLGRLGTWDLGEWGVRTSHITHRTSHIAHMLVRSRSRWSVRSLGDCDEEKDMEDTRSSGASE